MSTGNVEITYLSVLSRNLKHFSIYLKKEITIEMSLDGEKRAGFGVKECFDLLTCRTADALRSTDSSPPPLLPHSLRGAF